MKIRLPFRSRPSVEAVRFAFSEDPGPRRTQVEALLALEQDLRQLGRNHGWTQARAAYHHRLCEQAGLKLRAGEGISAEDVRSLLTQ